MTDCPHTRDDQPVQYIDRPDALVSFCRRMAGRPWLAVDTEFMREHTYRPRLCLVQISDGREIACIDPLAIEDLSPLIALLGREDSVKVFHAASQDMEIFYDLEPTALPRPVFDTQIAAAVLGFGAQVSYGALVQRLLGHSLDKQHARSDWLRRPLSDEELQYAADDVRYLGEVYLRLKTELERRGRLTWIEQDLAQLSDPGRYVNRPELAWRRLKRLGRLRPRARSAAQRLAAWREKRAQYSDRPRQWILKDDTLMDIAQRLPRDIQSLQRIRGLPDKIAKQHGEEILGMIADALADPEPPEPAERAALSPAQEAIADLLFTLVRLRAAQAEVTPALVAGRKDIERLVQGERDLPVLSGWRRQLVGDELQATLCGRLAFVIQDGQLVARPPADDTPLSRREHPSGG